VDDPRLIEEERGLELEAVDRGVERYQAFRAKNPGAGRPEATLAGRALDAVTAAVAKRKAEVETGEVVAAAGLMYTAPMLMYFPPDLLAACALSTVIQLTVRSFVSKKPRTRQAIIASLGENVETMFHLLQAKEMDKELYNILRKTIKNWDARRARRFYKRVTGLNRAWTYTERLHIGGLLYKMVVDETGWFYEMQTGAGFECYLHDEVCSALEGEHEQMALLAPFQYPMVIQPADWGWDEQQQRVKRGGYIFHNYDIFKPINVGDKPPKLGNAPMVFEAMNAMQHTGWAINQNTAPIMEAIWKAGGGWAGVPKAEPIITKVTGPRAPIGSSKDAIAEIKKERGKLWDAEAEEVSPRIAMLYRRQVVERMARFDRFFYVYQLDWRGRIYPVIAALSPQGDDLDRGLLRFAEEIEQTDEGRWWLDVHLANCWANDGLDKESFDERVAWTRRNVDRIRSVCADPLGDKWWAEAESPWQFLAACFERCRTDGKTSLPIGIDGTCNGLQHYSAIGLDPVGGAAVNLVPSDRPADVYGMVTVQVIADIQARVGSPVPPLPPLKRKVFKRGVMTLPYGLTPIGMRDQFIEDGWMEGLPDPYESATFLRDRTMEAIGKVVVKAMEYMAWLKQVAAAANAKGIPLQWTAPTGMVVTQDYVLPVATALRLPGIPGQVVFQLTPETRRVLNRTKQSNGICPNIIHTHDAAHLMMTVVACVKVGITAFHMIHDSYGTHGPRVPLLGVVTRDQFILIYQKENPLERFKRDTEQRLGESLPELPKRGTLDLEQVRQSRYFFG
jgi:DNA-directed RNA polymerase